jgi:hypothetical protein
MAFSTYMVAALLCVATINFAAVKATFSCYDTTVNGGQASGCIACSKTVASTFGYSAAVKQCQTISCTPVDATFAGAGAATYCCYSNLCNAAVRIVNSNSVIAASLIALLIAIVKYF